MSAHSLSDILEIITEIMDGTCKTVSIPEKAESIDIFSNQTVGLYMGLNDLITGADPIIMTGSVNLTGTTPFKLPAFDLAGRDLYFTGTSGTLKILVKKSLI